VARQAATTAHDRSAVYLLAPPGLMAVNVATGEFEILTSQSDDARAISYANV